VELGLGFAFAPEFGAVCCVGCWVVGKSPFSFLLLLGSISLTKGLYL